jgi:hypothetical protein
MTGALLPVRQTNRRNLAEVYSRESEVYPEKYRAVCLAVRTLEIGNGKSPQIAGFFLVLRKGFGVLVLG